MAISADLASQLDKAYEDLTLAEVLDAPVAAISGVSEGDADKLAEAFGIKTVRDLGTSKYFRIAAALTDLDGVTK
jgi:hypothetical protein